jgi:hypothetical protein
LIRADAEDEQNRIFTEIGSSIDKFQGTPPAQNCHIVRQRLRLVFSCCQGGGAAGAVLPARSAHDDADESGEEAVALPEGEAAAAADAASAAAAGAARAATCKCCPFVSALYCILQSGYAWPVHQEGQCFEPGHSSFDRQHFLELWSKLRHQGSR